MAVYVRAYFFSKTALKLYFFMKTTFFYFKVLKQYFLPCNLTKLCKFWLHSSSWHNPIDKKFKDICHIEIVNQ